MTIFIHSQANNKLSVRPQSGGRAGRIADIQPAPRGSADGNDSPLVDWLAKADQCDLNAEDAAICGAIISLARSLELKTVAEGVERPAQLEFLKAEGCLAYQGFITTPPLPAADFVDWLRRR